MNKISSLFLGLLLISGVAFADIPQIGVNPVPNMTGTTLAETTDYDAANTVYNYSYTISVPSSATGKIEEVRMDMTAPPYAYFGSVGFPLTIPYGAAGALPFNSVLYLAGAPTLPHNDSIIFFGEKLSQNWMGDIDADGNGTFGALNDSAEVGPGQTASGFIIQSPGQPTIKDVQLVPDWMLDEGDSDLTPSELDQASTIAGQLVIHVPALGPSAYFPLSEDQWTQFQTDVNKAIQLGWISDSRFANTVVSELAAARTAFDAQGPAYISSQLTTLQNTIASANSSQLNQSAYELLSMNVAAMIAQLPPPGSQAPTPQYSPVLKLKLSSSPTLALGQTATVVANVTDEANSDAPIAGYPIDIVVEGTNYKDFEGQTDANGNFTASYAGTREGTDTINLLLYREETIDSVAFTWSGGPDLTIQSFIPPLAEWSGTGPIQITDVTQNIGDAPAGASVTNYYLSTSNPFDWNNAQLVGGRQVPVLAPGDTSSSGEVDITLPAGLSAGLYTLKACADDTHLVAETNELNNCETNQIAVPMKQQNPPPTCSNATPSAALIWPPNHKMVDVSIDGVTDPHNLPFTINITGIQQDEPVNSVGDGNTEPDGAGVGTTMAQVRAERSGIAVDGRLYFISFTAKNSAGATCEGTVTVGVPHDRGQASLPVDNGQRYDSTAIQ